MRLGDRLAFSNGTILLAAAAAALFAAFDADTNALIPLYAVGVFVAFTFSQSGMVVHWWRHRDPHWHKSMILNAIGAVLSAVVFVIAAVTKFTEGAWVALLLIALLAFTGSRIRRHYLNVEQALALHPGEQESPRHPIVPQPVAAPAHTELEESHDELCHLAIVPVGRLDRSSLRALAYAASLGVPVLAVHLCADDEEAERFVGYWQAWGDHLPLHIVDSPYRALTAPLARYIEALHGQRPELTLTVVLPELIVKHAWHQPLHNHTSRRLRRALRDQPGVVTTTVPLHLRA
jgi:K+ potassium transporter